MEFSFGVLRMVASKTISLFQAYVWSNPWRAAVVLFLGFNIKVLPLAWHASHFIFNKQRRVSAKKHSQSAIFEPVISQHTTPLLDIDFNLHKSNSTFLIDLDISRLHLVGALFKDVADPTLKPGPTADGKLGGLKTALGGVSLTFHSEIKPFETFEIWSRVLCWDEKWLYVVSHFVKKDKVAPKGYRVTPQKHIPARQTDDSEKDKQQSEEFACSAEESKKVLFASAITKYVFKQGRKSIRPSIVMTEAGLLFDATEDYSTSGWSKERVEQERLKGLKIATGFASLDQLKEFFSGDSSFALGKF